MWRRLRLLDMPRWQRELWGPNWNPCGGSHGLEPRSRKLEAARRQGQGEVGQALTAINGRREELEGKIQQRYGVAKDQARKEIDDWFTAQGF
jgi:uncharacterized protein YjbJ (UPF0337 family)